MAQRAGSFLLFSDIIGNQMHRWDAHGGVSSFRQPSQMANGNTWDRQGRLLTCEHATSRVTRTERDGSITVLASHYEGLALNSPNDIVVKQRWRHLLHRPDLRYGDVGHTAYRASLNWTTAASTGSIPPPARLTA